MDDAAVNDKYSFHDSLREAILKRLPTTRINFEEYLITSQELSALDPWGDLRGIARDLGDWRIEFR